MLVRPGKAIGLALLFTGIGFALMTIVVNLRLTALILPGTFARIANAIKGEMQPMEPPGSPGGDLWDLAPRWLFYGMLIGALIVVVGTFPLALTRIINARIFLRELQAGNTASLTFQNAKRIQLMLEHFIGPWVGTGIALIFYYIGKFFGNIVTFVVARRQIISEGVQTACYFYAESDEKP